MNDDILLLGAMHKFSNLLAKPNTDLNTRFASGPAPLKRRDLVFCNRVFSA